MAKVAVESTVKMLKAFIPILLAAAASGLQPDHATRQLAYYKNCTAGTRTLLTTESGAPVEYRHAMSSLNHPLMENEHVVDSFLRFVHERIPERVVHARGNGAFGYFKLTRDCSDIMDSKLFSEVGKITEIFTRFSIGFGLQGTRDTNLETRGFAIKFKSTEGNFDLLTLNSPIFAFNDPARLTLLHAIKKNPVTNFDDPNALWDTMIQVPEALATLFYLFSTHNMPTSYSNMETFGVHLYQVCNKHGKINFVKWVVTPTKPVTFLNETQRAQAAADNVFYARGLHNSIVEGDYPTWTLNLQILSMEDVKKEKYRVFDVTKELSRVKYPLIPIGIIVLTKNPSNHFSEVEQASFSPGNLIPGIQGSPDKIFETRRFMYRESAIHRLGINFRQIPVNCPIHSPAVTYNRDGVPPVNYNGGQSPNYFPNSFSGPVPHPNKKCPPLIKIHEEVSDNFAEVDNFYAKTLNSAGRKFLIETFLATLCQCEKFLQQKVVDTFKKINADLTKRIIKGLANC